MNKKIISCHHCDSEVQISDKYDEYDATDFSFCPLCGSENIEVQ